MTTSDDRAKVLELERIFADEGCLGSAWILSQLRSALSLPDAAAIKAQARMHRPVGPVLSDAEVLERAAEILSTLRTAADQDPAVKILRANAAILRQPPAPEPDPDVFVAFANASFRSDKYTSDDAREWFGPLVEALERIQGKTTEPVIEHIANAALAQLRARAKEAN